MEQKRKITLKEWATEDRPREKMLLKGRKELSNAELVAILIGSGTEGQSAVDVAKELLKSVDNRLSLLGRMEVSDLVKNHKGIGTAKAISIIAALELGYRLLNEKNNEKATYVNNSENLFNIIAPSLINLEREEFWVIYMNTRKKVLYKERISVGGMTDVNVDLRTIFSTALEKNAVSFAVAHNHPSGNTSPSRMDKNLTTSILEASKILRIEFTDHIIVGIGDDDMPTYFSFHDNGIL